MGNTEFIDTTSQQAVPSSAQDARNRVLDALQAWDQQELLTLLADKPDSPLYQQLAHFDNWYKGGVDGYLSTATKLYAELRGETTEDNKSSDEIKLKSWLDIPVDCSGPQIVFGSGFALSQTTLAKKFINPSAISITARSTLIVEGAEVTFDALDLDGAVRIVACPGAKVKVKSLSVKNAGVEYEAVLADGDPVDAMRGYRLKQEEVNEFRFDTPGNYVIDEMRIEFKD
ncbi:hypothetical protein PInf_017398 [Phytophthora infestans]|nr:hypothetical protein PInf_017398 [Phytophthora infestans]